MDPPADPPAHLPFRYQVEQYAPGTYRDYDSSVSEPQEDFTPSTDEEASLNPMLVNDRVPLEQEGHSLPTPDEAKNATFFASSSASSRTDNPYSGRRKRMWALIGVGLVVLTIIIAMGATIPKNNSNGSPTGSASALDGVGSNGSNNGNDNNGGGTTNPDMNTQRTASRFNQVAGYLGLKGITSTTVLDDVNSPQYAAAKWIADYDQLKVPVPEPGTHDYEFEQRYILATFYYALAGPKWLSNLKFLTSSSVCDWNLPFNMTNELGRESTWDLGATCGDNGNVEILFIGTSFYN